MEEKKLQNSRVLWMAIYIIVTALYILSIIFTVCGIAFLIFILFIGDINMENGYLLALGMLLFLPLRHYKKSLERGWPHKRKNNK